MTLLVLTKAGTVYISRVVQVIKSHLTNCDRFEKTTLFCILHEKQTDQNRKFKKGKKKKN